MKLMSCTTGMLLLLSLAAVGAAETDAEPRQSLTAQGNGITRGGVIDGNISFDEFEAVSYTHLTLPTTCNLCRSRWSPYH